MNLFTTLSTLSTTSPVTTLGLAVAGTGLALYAVTRAPEFFLLAASAGVYAAIAALPFVQA
jgi:hypothetical protein